MNPNSYVCTITADQAVQLRALLDEQFWELDTAPYAHWRARKDKTTVVAYESGKVTVQGKKTADCVQFIIEPHILKEMRFGYEDVIAEQENPRMFEPHAGIDESGKGDYFGPMVIAAAYVDDKTARSLLSAGVQDSKAIKSDKKMKALAETVRKTTRGKFAIITIGPPAYNRMYESMQNVNRILAWGHARALENLLQKQPDCPRALSDQFGNKASLRRALLELGKKIEFEQRPKAESDVAVAAASILARDAFVRRLAALGEDIGTPLPKGASKAVIHCAASIISAHGKQALQSVAKMHFRTTDNAAAAAMQS